MNQLTICLSIPREKVLRYYEGSAQHVVATATNGQTVRFPASCLRPFITDDGVKGVFIIQFDEKGKLIKFDNVR